MFWIPIALMAASAAASAAANRKEKKGYDSARQLSAEGRDDYRVRKQQNLNKLHTFAADQYGPGREQKWSQAADQTEARRMGELAAAGPGQQISTGDPMDADQLAWAGKVAADEGQRLHDTVRLLSKASAPQTAGFDEGVNSANFYSDYGSSEQDANNMLRAFGGDVDGRLGKASQAGGPYNMLSSLFAAGASMYGGGMGGAMGGAKAAHGATGIPYGYPHVG